VVEGTSVPRHRLGHEGDPVVASLVAQAAVDPQHQLEVLADARGVEPTDLDHHVPAEDPERAADQDQRPGAGPAGAPEEEGAQVLHHLDAGQPLTGHADVDDAARDHAAAVDRADRPAGGDHPGRVVRERLGDPQQPVGFEDGVGVDHRDQRLGGGVEGEVERLGAAGVLLADDEQAGAAVARDVHVDDPGRDRHVLRELARHRDEVERLAQPVERAVAAAVVHDDHLVAGVAQRQQRLHGGDDAGRLVVGRDEQRDARREGATERLDLGLAPPVLGAEVQ
jgi:hypothetical protein